MHNVTARPDASELKGRWLYTVVDYCRQVMGIRTEWLWTSGWNWRWRLRDSTSLLHGWFQKPTSCDGEDGHGLWVWTDQDEEYGTLLTGQDQGCHLVQPMISPLGRIPPNQQGILDGRLDYSPTGLLTVTVHTAGRIQEHADKDVNSNNSL